MWCWQENPDDRPTANEIIEKVNSIEFSKLLDGIRLHVCDQGQVSNYNYYAVIHGTHVIIIMLLLLLYLPYNYAYFR